MTSKHKEEVILCRLVRLFRQSPLMYLSESNVWTYRGDESLKLALIDVIADHQNFVDRAETILVAEQCELPKVFFLYPSQVGTMLTSAFYCHQLR